MLEYDSRTGEIEIIGYTETNENVMEFSECGVMNIYIYGASGVNVNVLFTWVSLVLSN